MHKSSGLAGLLLISLLAGCSKHAAPPPSRIPGSDANAPPANGEFMGRMWISTTPGAARGSFVIFLADRTMLMGSCVETYRLSKWGVAGEKIRWIEDTIPIEAAVAIPRRNQMTLAIAGRDREQTFVLANTPYVCPDMPQ